MNMDNVMLRSGQQAGAAAVHCRGGRAPAARAAGGRPRLARHAPGRAPVGRLVQAGAAARGPRPHRPHCCERLALTHVLLHQSACMGPCPGSWKGEDPAQLPVHLPANDKDHSLKAPSCRAGPMAADVLCGVRGARRDLTLWIACKRIDEGPLRWDRQGACQAAGEPLDVAAAQREFLRHVLARPCQHSWCAPCPLAGKGCLICNKSSFLLQG